MISFLQIVTSMIFMLKNDYKVNGGLENFFRGGRKNKHKKCFILNFQV